MKMKAIVVSLLGCVSVLTVLSAFACSSCGFQGTRPNAFTFSLLGGYMDFDSKRHISNVGVPMAAMGYDFTNHWGLEGLLGIFNSVSKRTSDSGTGIKGTLFAIDALYHFTPFHQMELFALAGPGIIGMTPNGNDAQNEGNINAGVGLNIYANNIVAFRIEGRDFYTWVGGKNDLMADAGVTFLLDTKCA